MLFKVAKKFDDFASFKTAFLGEIAGFLEDQQANKENEPPAFACIETAMKELKVTEKKERSSEQRAKNPLGDRTAQFLNK